LVTFEYQASVRTGALLSSNSLLDLPAANPAIPGDMSRLLAEKLDLVRRLVAEPPAAAVRPLDQVRLLPPIPRPGKLICIGYNYRGHQVVQDPQYPDVFVKTENTIVGPGATVRLPKSSSQVDYEGELAVVIGRPAYGVAESDALAYVAGYSMLNDVSARDWQNHGSQWVLGKSFDTFGPFGPALVTADEIGDVQNLPVEVRLNGEVTVRSSTAVMVFPICRLIAYLSQAMTLQVGDVIATGTPQKLPAVLARGQRWLAQGDTVEIEIGPLGTLSNTFASEPPLSNP
jgi:acylpyruvate hydrolase